MQVTIEERLQTGEYTLEELWEDTQGVIRYVLDGFGTNMGNAQYKILSDGRVLYTDDASGFEIAEIQDFANSHVTTSLT